MIKTSPFHQQPQIMPPHQEEAATPGAAEKSPPLIASESGDRNGDQNEVCIIEMGNVGEKDGDEKGVCRICQLSCDQLPASLRNVDLVLLGCDCKGDLGTSHYHCAYAWFRQKGNRTCEICGKPAKNIDGIEDTGFRAFEPDISIIFSAQTTVRSSSVDGHRQWTKSLCNLMLAIFVIAFLLPLAIHPSKFF